MKEMLLRLVKQISHSEVLIVCQEELVSFLSEHNIRFLFLVFLVLVMSLLSTLFFCSVYLCR